MVVKSKMINSSVVLCTHNGEKFIKEQATSIISQSVLPDEIIICDDFSTDRTLAIVESVTEKAPIDLRIVVNKRRLGSTKNFEQGIKMARGEVIFLSDQDDIWSQDKVEQINRQFIKNPTITAVFSNGNVIDDRGKQLGYNLWDAFHFKKAEQGMFRSCRAFQLLMKRSVVTGATMAFRAKYRNLLLPIPATWVHDSWLAILLSAVGPIEYIREPLIDYRIHHEQQIGARLSNFHERYKLASTSGREAYLEGANRFKIIRSRIISAGLEENTKYKLVSMIDTKINHLRKRGEMNHHLKRIPIIVQEVINKNYFHYSNGIRSAFTDLLLSQ